jgi:hypothetical protein
VLFGYWSGAISVVAAFFVVPVYFFAGFGFLSCFADRFDVCLVLSLLVVLVCLVVVVGCW